MQVTTTQATAAASSFAVASASARRTELTVENQTDVSMTISLGAQTAPTATAANSYRTVAAGVAVTLTGWAARAAVSGIATGAATNGKKVQVTSILRD